MLTFEQFLKSTVEKGGSIDTLFEERLFALIGTLEKIAKPLAAEGTPYELIGGAAVMVQVNRVKPSAVRNTKDIDIMVHRSDLDRIKEVARRQEMPVRLIFTGEKVKSNQVIANPSLRPEHYRYTALKLPLSPWLTSC